MQVAVAIYGYLRDQPEKKQPFQIELEMGATGRDLLKILNIAESEYIVISANGRAQEMDETLRSGDQIDIFPLMNGG